MVVMLVNEKTGEKKNIKVGWSWTSFFFSGCLGIPLFLRRLHVWGTFMCVLFLSMVAADFYESPFKLVLGAINLGISIGFGRHANRMAFIQYLKDGWEPLDPAAPEYVHAKRVWKLEKMLAHAA